MGDCGPVPCMVPTANDTESSPRLLAANGNVHCIAKRALSAVGLLPFLATDQESHDVTEGGLRGNDDGERQAG